MRAGEPEKKIEISEAGLRCEGRKPEAAQASGSNSPGGEDLTEPRKPSLIEMMLEQGNMLNALKAVERNGGAAGVDGMRTDQLRPYLKERWETIKDQLLNGEYQPRPVRRVGYSKARSRNAHAGSANGP